MKRFARDLIITAVLIAATITLGVFHQKYDIGTLPYNTFGGFIIAGCVVLFGMCVKLIMDIIIAVGEVRSGNDGH